MFGFCFLPFLLHIYHLKYMITIVICLCIKKAPTVVNITPMVLYIGNIITVANTPSSDCLFTKPLYFPTILSTLFTYFIYVLQSNNIGSMTSNKPAFIQFFLYVTYILLNHVFISNMYIYEMRAYLYKCYIIMNNPDNMTIYIYEN